MTSIASTSGPCGPRNGVTLIELLLAVVIGAIAFFPLTVPFVSERSFTGAGRRQAEAQRDAQMALRAIARAARQGTNPSPAPGNTSDTFTFQLPLPSCPGAEVRFDGGPSLNGTLQMTDGCSNRTALLIDGVRSRVTNLVFTGVTNRLVRVGIDVTYEGQQTERLETELFLRNAT